MENIGKPKKAPFGEHIALMIENEDRAHDKMLALRELLTNRADIAKIEAAMHEVKVARSHAEDVERAIEYRIRNKEY